MGYYILHLNGELDEATSYEYVNDKLDTSQMDGIHLITWAMFGFCWGPEVLHLSPSVNIHNSKFHKQLKVLKKKQLTDYMEKL